MKWIDGLFVVMDCDHIKWREEILALVYLLVDGRMEYLSWMGGNKTFCLKVANLFWCSTLVSVKRQERGERQKRGDKRQERSSRREREERRENSVRERRCRALRPHFLPKRRMWWNGVTASRVPSHTPTTMSYSSLFVSLSSVFLLCFSVSMSHCFSVSLFLLPFPPSSHSHLVSCRVWRVWGIPFSLSRSSSALSVPSTNTWSTLRCQRGRGGKKERERERQTDRETETERQTMRERLLCAEWH